jgi:chromate transport protein ChrA
MQRPAPVREPGSTVLMEVGAVALLLVNMFLSMVNSTRDGMTGPELLGATFAPAIIALIVYGIARLIRKAKTRRGRAMLVFITMFVVLCGNLGNLGGAK